LLTNEGIQVINFLLNLCVIPIFIYIFKTEKRLTKIETILGICKYCKGGDIIEKKNM